MRKKFTYEHLLAAKKEFDLGNMPMPNYTQQITQAKEALIKKVISKFIGRECLDTDGKDVTLATFDGYPNEQWIIYKQKNLGF